MNNYGTIIVRDFPQYGNAIILPTIIAPLGMSRYGLDLEGNWWEISHEVSQTNFNYQGNIHGEAEQKAFEKLKEYCRSYGIWDLKIYGWRGNLYGQQKKLLYNACSSIQRENHIETVAKYEESQNISFRSFWENCPYEPSRGYPFEHLGINSDLAGHLE